MNCLHSVATQEAIEKDQTRLRNILLLSLSLYL